jgi:uncharacterized protein (DUF1778 family)
MLVAEVRALQSSTAWVEIDRPIRQESLLPLLLPGDIKAAQKLEQHRQLTARVKGSEEAEAALYAKINALLEGCIQHKKQEVNSVSNDISSTGKRPRISIDVDPETRRRIRVAAAQKNLLVSQYILKAVKERLWQDLGEQEDLDSLLTLNAKYDPLLADLWNNKKDAAYDCL